MKRIDIVAQTNVRNIELNKLEMGKYVFDFQLDSEFFVQQERTEILSGSVAAKAYLTLREDDFELSMTADGMVQVACDRCLDPMDVPVAVDEQAVEMEEDTTTLDLEWLAYELIVVNLPLVHSHPEGECNPAMQELLQAHLCSTPDEPENTI